jgi:Family of unknown function (DUF6312)
MSTSSGGEGRGETTDPAGTKAGRTEKASVEASQPQPPPPLPPYITPSQLMAGVPNLVYRIDYKRKKKRKKRKYSSGLKDIQQFERGLSRASQRLSRAVTDGLRTYRRRRDKSARKKKDGAIRDAVENWSKGLSRTIRVSSDAPYDVGKKVNTSRFGRQLRDAVRLVVPPLFR